MNEHENPGDILVVDDQPLDLKPLYEALRQQGHNVRAVDSGRQALQAVQYEMPELILLETRMPDLDGFEVCRRLKAEPLTHDIPVVFLTELSDTPSKARAFNLGAVDYLAKPYETDELLARVKAHLAVYRSRRAIMEKAKNRIRQLAESNQELTKQIDEIKPMVETPLPDNPDLKPRIVELEAALQTLKEQLQQEIGEHERTKEALTAQQTRSDEQAREHIMELDAQNRTMAQEIADHKRSEDALRNVKNTLEARISEQGKLVQETEDRLQAALETHQQDQKTIAQLQERLETLARTQAQQAQETEQSYRLLFEAAADAIIVIDQENAQILDANPAACQLYGYTHDEFLLLRIINISEDPQETIQAIQRGDKLVPLRHHRKKDGVVFPCEIASGIFRLGSRSRLVEFVRDITGRIKSEEELKKQRDALDAMVDERVAELEAKETQLAEEAAVRRKAEEALHDAIRETERRVRLAEEQENQITSLHNLINEISGVIGHPPRYPAKTPFDESEKA